MPPVPPGLPVSVRVTANSFMMPGQIPPLACFLTQTPILPLVVLAQPHWHLRCSSNLPMAFNLSGAWTPTKPSAHPPTPAQMWFLKSGSFLMLPKGGIPPPEASMDPGPAPDQ